MTHAGKRISNPNKAVFNLIATNLLHSNTEAWSIIHETMDESQMPLITPGFIV